MKGMIEQLWYGNLAPVENCGAGDPEIEELIRLMERHKEQLGGALSGEAKSIFEKYADTTEEYVCMISKTAFCRGFSLAAKLLHEALYDS